MPAAGAVAEARGRASAGEGRETVPERLQHTDAEPATGATAAAAATTERHRGGAQPASERAAGERFGSGGDVAQSAVTAQPAQHGPDRHVSRRLHQ